MVIKIVADNCCDLPQEIIDCYGIGITHLLVRFGDRVYQPDELSNREFYEMMESSPILPSTSQPAVEEMMRVYSQSLEKGDEVLAVHFSSGISGTYQGGVVAQRMLDNPRLHVFDTRKASVGCGLLVIEAARMAKRGETMDSILARMEQMRKRMQCIFTVGKMECLIKGGRVSRTKGLLADVLDIKPILHMDEEGCIMPYDKVRGSKAAIRRLLDIMGRVGSGLSDQTVGICHGAVPETATLLKESIEERFSPREIVIGEIGPVIGAHVGSGTYSVFFEKE